MKIVIAVMWVAIGVLALASSARQWWLSGSLHVGDVTFGALGCLILIGALNLLRGARWAYGILFAGSAFLLFVALVSASISIDVDNRLGAPSVMPLAVFSAAALIAVGTIFGLLVLLRRGGAPASDRGGMIPGRQT